MFSNTTPVLSRENASSNGNLFGKSAQVKELFGREVRTEKLEAVVEMEDAFEVRLGRKQNDIVDVETSTPGSRN